MILNMLESSDMTTSGSSSVVACRSLSKGPKET